MHAAPRATAAPSPTAAPPDARALSRFGRTVGGAFLVLAAAAWWRGRAATAIACGAIGGALVLAALVAPARLAVVERAWMGLGHALSRVTTPVFMGVVYFGLLTPIAAVLRLVRRRPLAAPPRDASAWVTRPPDARQSDLQRQF